MPTPTSRRRSTRVSAKPPPDYARSVTVTPSSTRSASPTNTMTSNPLPPPPTAAEITNKLAPVRASRRLRKPSEKAEAAHPTPHNLASPPRDDDAVNTTTSPLPEQPTPLPAAAGANKRKSPPAAQPSPPPTGKRARTTTPQKRSHKKKPRDTTRALPPSPSATTESVQSSATDAAMEKEEHVAATKKKSKDCAVAVELQYGGATPELRRFLSAAYRHFKGVREARWYKWNGKLWETFTVAGVYAARKRGVLEGWRKEKEKEGEVEVEEEVERLVRCVAEMVCEDGKSEEELLASWGCKKV